MIMIVNVNSKILAAVDLERIAQIGDQHVGRIDLPIALHSNM